MQVRRLGSGQAMGHAHHRIHRCAGGHRSPVPGVRCRVPGVRCQVSGLRSQVSGMQVSGVRDGRQKTGDGASHGRGIAHDRMGTHGVPWPVSISAESDDRKSGHPEDPGAVHGSESEIEMPLCVTSPFTSRHSCHRHPDTLQTARVRSDPRSRPGERRDPSGRTDPAV